MSERPRPPWSWRGAVVFVLAACLGLGWAVSVILVATPWTPPVDDATSDLLSTIGGVLAGAVVAFVSASIARSERPDE